MRTANPALSANTFSQVGQMTDSVRGMTIQGTVNKAGILLILVVAAAIYTWGIFFEARNPAVIMPWMMGGIIGGLIVAVVTVFKKAWSPVTAPIYAVLEGLVLGGISAIFEANYPGIAMQAVTLTFGVFLGLLIVYKSGFVRVTEKFRMGVMAATGGIFLVYLFSMILNFFNFRMPYIHESGLIGIGFSLFVVVVAALNLILDFDFIERGALSGAPKFMEWYAAFGLMVTLIWLYLEILRLLAKLKDRR